MQEKEKEESEKITEVFITEELMKLQIEEHKTNVVSKFLNPKLDLKISRSLSPLPLERQRTILSLPSSRHPSLSSPFSTSTSSLSSPMIEKRKDRRHFLFRSLDTTFCFGQTAPAAAQARAVSPSRLRFLGQIYRHSLEQHGDDSGRENQKPDCLFEA